MAYWWVIRTVSRLERECSSLPSSEDLNELSDTISKSIAVPECDDVWRRRD